MQMIEANWVAFVVAILAVLIVGWLIFRSATRPKVRSHRPDVLDEGQAPAARNQALIDAPAHIATASASLAATGADTMIGLGEIAAAAVVEEVHAVEEEEVKAAPPPSPPPAQTVGEADDLRQIKGLGPKLVTMLHGLGVTRFSQIAGWSDEDIDRIDAQLGTFAGRIRRDSWVEQAKFLTAGDTSGFEGKFGKL